MSQWSFVVPCLKQRGEIQFPQALYLNSPLCGARAIGSYTAISPVIFKLPRNAKQREKTWAGRKFERGVVRNGFPAEYEVPVRPRMTLKRFLAGARQYRHCRSGMKLDQLYVLSLLIFRNFLYSLFAIKCEKNAKTGIVHRQ